MSESALSGLRVVELAQGIAGPYCGKLLAGLGAEVVKVEPPAGDWARRRRPFFHDRPSPETSGLFLYLNLGKQGVTLDVEAAGGPELLRSLVQDADILIEDFAPARLEELGVGYGDLSARNPGLVMTRITPFGQTGPNRDYRGGELTAWNAAGYAYLTPASAASSDEPPLKLGGNQALFMTGLAAAASTMAAAIWRERSGEGQQVDVSTQEAVLVGNDSVWSQYLAWQDIVPTRAVRGSFSYFPCKDGYLSLLFVRDDQWERMVELMGNPEWATDLFATGHDRRQNWDVLFTMLSEWFMQYTKAEIVERAQAQRIPIAPVYTGEEVANSPQLNGRDYFVDVEHPETGSVSYPGAPYKLSETPWQVFRPAPRLGEHNDQVFGDRLGLASEELERLHAERVI